MQLLQKSDSGTSFLKKALPAAHAIKQPLRMLLGVAAAHSHTLRAVLQVHRACGIWGWRVPARPIRQLLRRQALLPLQRGRPAQCAVNSGSKQPLHVGAVPLAEPPFPPARNPAQAAPQTTRAGCAAGDAARCTL